jgi:NAD(P)H-flavin reductase
MSALLVSEAPLTHEAAPMQMATVRRVVRETPDTTTIWLTLADPAGRVTYRFEPGQFNMLYLFGVGESAISICSDPGTPRRLGHTIRSVGRVTNLVPALKPGAQVGVRGPFGRPWPMGAAAGRDLAIVAGGLGMAPLRPAVYAAMRNRADFGRVILMVGARAPEHMLFRQELDAWSHWMRGHGIEVLLTVDVADDAWPYGDGVVTTLFERAKLDPARTTAFVCGPEIMMTFAVRGLAGLSIPPERIYLSLERNMQCGERLCGHCQLGPKFVCFDGPVFAYPEIADLMEVPEL